MKQSPPRPCYLSSRCCISSRDGDDIGGGESEMRECARSSVKGKVGEGGERERGTRREGGGGRWVIFNHRDDGRFPGGPLMLAQEARRDRMAATELDFRLAKFNR